SVIFQVNCASTSSAAAGFPPTVIARSFGVILPGKAHLPPISQSCEMSIGDAACDLPSVPVTTSTSCVQSPSSLLNDRYSLAVPSPFTFFVLISLHSE